MIGRLFGISRDRFWHARKEVMYGGVPWAVDVAVAATERPGPGDLRDELRCLLR